MKEFGHNILQFILPASIAFWAFISPIAGVLTAVGVFISADMIFARYRCYVQKIKWTSRKARAGLLPKVITYNCFVLSFFVMDKFVINDFMSLFSQIPFALTKILAMVLIWIELKSIDESFEAIKGKSLFTYLIDLLKSVKKINKQISNINEGKPEIEKAPETPEA